MKCAEEVGDMLETMNETNSKLSVATEFKLRISRHWLPAEGVVSLDLQSPDGEDLPSWTPGAHIDVVTADGSARQYSLCGSPEDKRTWRIAVLREAAGRGGSRWLHDEVSAGDVLTVRGPRNHFPLDPSSSYLFIAGGIGVTPLLPMLSEAKRTGANVQFVYCGRSRSTMAFLDECNDLENGPDLYPEAETGRVNLEELLSRVRPDTLVYSCGPSELLDAVERRSSHWPEGTVRMERFSARAFDGSLPADNSFEVELARSGQVLTVPADRTILSVLEDAGADILSSCEQGTCGSCITPVLSGALVHRDTVLTAAEKKSGQSIVVCVSRCSGPRLVLDL